MCMLLHMLIDGMLMREVIRCQPKLLLQTYQQSLTDSLPVIMKRKGNSLNLVDVLNRVNNTNTESKCLTVEELIKEYGNSGNITQEIKRVLKHEFKLDIEIEKTFTYSKHIWLCKLNLGSFTKEIFEGVGVTKQTAELNSRLAALLWLKQLCPVRKVQPNILVQIHENNRIVELFNGSNGKSILPNDNQKLSGRKVESTGISKMLEDIVIQNNLNSVSDVNGQNYCTNKLIKEPFKLETVQTKEKKKKSKRKNSTSGKKKISSDLAASSQSCKSLVKPTTSVSNIQKRLHSIKVSGSSKECYNENSSLLLEPKILEDIIDSSNVDQLTPKPSDCKHIILRNVTKTSDINFRDIYKKYPYPKDTLHKFYDILVSDLRNKSLQLSSSCKITGSSNEVEWVFTYNLKWPENVKVTVHHPRKKQASLYAALRSLAFINESGLDISRKGRPLINRNDVASYFAKPDISASILNIGSCNKSISSEQTSVLNTQKRMYSVKTREDSKESSNEKESVLIEPKKVEVNIKASNNEQQIDSNNNDRNGTPNINLHSLPKSSECRHITVKNITPELSTLKEIYKKYPLPKQTLCNFFQSLSTELKNPSLILSTSYRRIGSGKNEDCIFTYNLKWPENVKVSVQHASKKQASLYSALKSLAYLLETGKITPDGKPLIYTNDEIKKLVQKKDKTLNIKIESLQKMQEINQVFQTYIRPLIANVDYNYDGKISDLADDSDDLDVHLRRNPKYISGEAYMAKEKNHLPVSDFKEQFMDLIKSNNCVIVKGQPGCGKSTRIPQYVLESWAKDSDDNDLCRIAVTQPRRIAAISLSERVSDERDEMVGDIVGYQVRLKSQFIPKTGRILYCTTGILLRRLQSDPNLSTFSHVILDEAHERDLNTDLLMNLLKRALQENDKLKVIVMSATIDAETFSQYFNGAPIFEVPGFAYPVQQNYLDSSKFNNSKTLNMCKGEIPNVVHDEIAKVITFIHENKPEGAILVFLPGWEDLSKVEKMLSSLRNATVHILHSKLKDSEQYKIFSKPPRGIRKIILSTNIAETSITIDDVVYVVDSGIHKDQVFDNEKGISVIDKEWISKASVRQRSGRAGRCAPGESYHMYTEEKFQTFQDYSTPKILNSSLTKVILDSKTISDMSACDFMNSLITPPEKQAVERAVEELKQLELLDDNEKLTPLGRTLANFQLEPNLAKTMVNSVIFKCTTPIVDIVTLFSSETEMFGSLTLMDKESIKREKESYSKSSDHLALMKIYEKWLEFFEEDGLRAAKTFCQRMNLVHHKMEFINKLKDIHYGYLRNGLYNSVPLSDEFSDNDELIKAVLYSGTGNVLIHRNWDILKNRLKSNVNVLLTRHNHKATITSDSVNHRRRDFPSDFLVYINETRSNIRRVSTVRECSLIPPISVLLFNNNKLEITPVQTSADQEVPENLVYVSIKNTNLKFLLDKEKADILCDCKSAIDSSYKYLIHQLTYSGDDIPEFRAYWDIILENIDRILSNDLIK
ncbi:ATP-dependent RNA helicase DHX30-like isoform X2 [Sitophilus oryzae]|uniref:RNA helicase n=1 Tax=Sitophilus oryzae TaxID=7048 RepID=A0A6J2XUG6_SITOR|nr:ATP-dependent RNA helicase DHX30-like isoform X2 [Sitophilus oryzae]